MNDIIHKSVADAYNILYEAVKERWDFYGINDMFLPELTPIVLPMRRYYFMEQLKTLENHLTEICDASFDYNKFGEWLGGSNRIEWSWQHNTAIPRYKDTISDRMNEISRLLKTVALYPDPRHGFSLIRDAFAEYVKTGESAEKLNYDSDFNFVVQASNGVYYSVLVHNETIVNCKKTTSSSSTKPEECIRGKSTNYRYVYTPQHYRTGRNFGFRSPTLLNTCNVRYAINYYKDIGKGSEHILSDEDTCQMNFSENKIPLNFLSKIQSDIDEIWDNDNQVFGDIETDASFEYLITADNFGELPYKYLE